ALSAETVQATARRNTYSQHSSSSSHRTSIRSWLQISTLWLFTDIWLAQTHV
ncbi:Uncharacterized protein DAT39_000266, partial [Clarias magur]